jgi:hypothetical protein
MSTSTDELHAQAADVVLTNEEVTVRLVDGRTIIVPLVWYPRLVHAKIKERKNWRFIGGGEGIHWPDLDEDISVRNLLLGYPSGESHESFKRWLDSRRAKKE